MFEGVRWVVLLAVVAGCATTKSDLAHATAHYEEARYEAAVTWLDELESELPTMAAEERSTFLYLRGMSAYRLGQREDAVHYLALARESAALDPSSLSPSLSSTLKRALAALAPDTEAATDSLAPLPSSSP